MRPSAESSTAQPLELPLGFSLPAEASAVAPLDDDAVAELNRIYLTSWLETARGIGEYVLEAFSAIDPANFRQHSSGHLTFRELRKRDDLKVDWQFIWNAVAVVEQYCRLPRDVAEALTLSHHKLLLTTVVAQVRAVLAAGLFPRGNEAGTLELTD